MAAPERVSFIQEIKLSGIFDKLTSANRQVSEVKVLMGSNVIKGNAKNDILILIDHT